ncbi:DUF3269 family protein, partial [Staphylococcus aureus]|uniref:DUF3269 family protein n=1 Tax=Staphylococcus aureus TaxID=1280 RepID=UPI00321FAB16
KEKYYLYREDGTEDIKVIKYKDNVNEVYSLTGAHFSDEKKIMTDRDLKRFKGARRLYIIISRRHNIYFLSYILT